MRNRSLVAYFDHELFGPACQMQCVLFRGRAPVLVDPELPPDRRVAILVPARRAAPHRDPPTPSTSRTHPQGLEGHLRNVAFDIAQRVAVQRRRLICVRRTSPDAYAQTAIGAGCGEGNSHASEGRKSLIGLVLTSGWEAGIRTPITWFRATGPTVERPPSMENRGGTNPTSLPNPAGAIQHEGGRRARPIAVFWSAD